MTALKDMHKRWSKVPAYRQAYDQLKGEFASVLADAESRKTACRSERAIGNSAEAERNRKRGSSPLSCAHSGVGHTSFNRSRR